MTPPGLSYPERELEVESKRMLVRKVWDYAIDLNDDFKVSKARVYPLSRNEKEEV